MESPCIVQHKIVENENFIFITHFCGWGQRCFREKGEESSSAELPDDADEKAGNANACAKCVSAIEKLVCSKMEPTTKAALSKMETTDKQVMK